MAAGVPAEVVPEVTTLCRRENGKCDAHRFVDAAFRLRPLKSWPACANFCGKDRHERVEACRDAVHTEASMATPAIRLASRCAGTGSVAVLSQSSPRTVPAPTASVATTT